MPGHVRLAAPLVVVVLLAVLPAVGCGGRTNIAPEPRERDAATAEPVELCNGADDDADGRIDESFRDSEGLYSVSAEHCGACEQPCGAIAHANGVECVFLDGLGRPGCAASDCEAGFAPTESGGCGEPLARICLTCDDNSDCGDVIGAECVQLGSEARCTVDCALGCPGGYVCQAGLCAPSGGSCDCTADAAFQLGCLITSDSGSQCVGVQHCDDGRLGPCELPEESCNGSDDDCDERVDEGFLDSNDAYTLDDRNCGACGIDCTRDAAAGTVLVCGGDPFAPTCGVHCPDGDDGVQVGDKLDADRRIDTGCECTVTSVQDSGGRPASEGGQLDSDCDGADGTVLDSLYVAVNGDDSGPGSPTRPLRSINLAVERAAASIGGPKQRSQVYVAAGTYTESVVMRDGVELHGGYRRDYLDLSAAGFEVVIQAPASGEAYAGAALVLSDVGTRRTLVEGFTLRGLDAAAAGQPAIAVLIERPGAELYLSQLRVRSGRPGRGADGADGSAGSGVSGLASAGEPPRAAVEDASHQCQQSDANRVRGGRAGYNVCGGHNVSGGAGGSPGCPAFFGAQQPSGSAGRSSSSASGGPGGAGSFDLLAPLLSMSDSCASPPCCGLADFSVPCMGAGGCEFPQPGAGGNGADGVAGAAGAACSNSGALGSFVAGRWQPGRAQDGTPGDAGGGGGGGGAGAGIEFQWTAPACQFADGLAGAGGGGGAGGCGGNQGLAGGSGGPAIGVLIVAADANRLPHLSGVRIESEDGARGGDGGAGGDGGPGGSGGSGGDLPIADKTTPSTAGPLPGQRGGRGGAGGAGGGGGGGCGGAVVGVWLTGLGAQPALGTGFVSGNDFSGLGMPGPGGAGGGGGVPAAAGHDGEGYDVLVR
jgi:hypothetical protein